MVEDASKVLSELITDFPDALCFNSWGFLLHAEFI